MLIDLMLLLHTNSVLKLCSFFFNFLYKLWVKKKMISKRKQKQNCSILMVLNVLVWLDFIFILFCCGDSGWVVVVVLIECILYSFSLIFPRLLQITCHFDKIDEYFCLSFFLFSASVIFKMHLLAAKWAFNFAC